MAGNVTFQTTTLATAPNATVVETEDQGGGVQRQVVKVGNDITVTGTVTVSGTVAATQSGTWNIGTVASITAPVAVTGTFWQATQPISAASLPLPALAATSTKQSDGTQKTQIVDGVGNVIGATSNALDVNIKSGFGTTIAVTQSTNPWIVAGAGTAGTAASGVVTVQGITSMTPVQVSQATAASLNATVVGTGTFAVQATISAGSAVIGHVITDTGSTTAVTGNVTVTQATGTNLHMVVDSGTVTTVSTVTAVTDITNSVKVVGPTASGSALTVAPVTTGARAATALPTAVADAQVVNLMADKMGRAVNLPITIRDLAAPQTTTISASTSETTIITAAASVFNDIIALIISNTSASTNTRIDIRDTTGGTIIFSLQSIGGAGPVGFVFPVPLPQTTVNTNWTAQCATSTTDLRVLAYFAKNR